MRAVLVVLLLFGAFMSVAGMNKVFAYLFDAEPLESVATRSAVEQPLSSLLLPDSFLETITTQASESAGITPTPDFCMDIPVLLYHHTQPLETAGLLGHAQLTVDSGIFDEQMRYLVENNYNIVSAEDLVHALLDRRALPPKTVVVTVDDGYQDNYTYAFLVAKKYKIIINFMIPTELIGKADYMTWDHLEEMVQSPYARVYNHTATHAALGYSSVEQIETELSSSSKALRENLGLKNTIFTYPYGSFNEYAVEQLKKHGFFGAYSTIEGKRQCRSEVMILQRLHIGNAPMSSYGF